MAVRAPDMRDKLAKSAFELFARDGIGSVNMDMIAAGADVTKGSLYWHYKSKKEVILAACSHYYRNWQQNINGELRGIADPLERLEKAIQFSVKSCMFDDKNRVFTTEIFALTLNDEDVRRSWAQFYDMVREFFVGLAEEAKAAGEIHTGDPRRAVDLMLVAFEGIKLRSVFEQGMKPSEETQFTCEFMQIFASLNSEN